MKKTIGILIVAGLMFFQAGTLFAAARSFLLTASVPTATGVSIKASSVNADTDAFTPIPDTATAMSFDTMTYNNTYGYWSPGHYFAVDIGTVGGSGSVTTVVSYTEGTNRNASVGGQGLGYKATAAFMKTTGSGNNTVDTPIAAHGKKRLIDVSGTTVTPAQVAGGWLRVYLGIVTDPAEVAGSQIFSNLDKPGSYDGTITFTATAS